MSSHGQVRSWHAEEGWGVIDSEDTPGGCWAHGSAVLVAGYRSLEPGMRVQLAFEVVDQDGYAYRAVEVWPTGQTPVRTEGTTGPSAAYDSAVSTSLDDPGPAPRRPA